MTTSPHPALAQSTDLDVKPCAPPLPFLEVLHPWALVAALLSAVAVAVGAVVWLRERESYHYEGYARLSASVVIGGLVCFFISLAVWAFR
jgi:predicted permease